MEVLRKAPLTPSHLGVFPGSFNPVTVAHIALAEAALSLVDEVVFVLPRAFPHKEYAGSTLEQRAELVRDAIAGAPRFSLGIAEGGLFLEIARECRAVYGKGVSLSFLCGRDAAERIVRWDYGTTNVWEEMLREFDLLVAPRSGDYEPDPARPARLRQIPLDPKCDEISATEVRRRMASGESWEHLVPESIRRKVREIYTP
jgi:nicotinate-nucleotide adenylyltransferase